jgi:hypothetical protein
MVTSTGSKRSATPAGRTRKTAIFTCLADFDFAGVNLPLPGHTESGDSIGILRIPGGAIAYDLDSEGKGNGAASDARAFEESLIHAVKCGVVSPAALLTEVNKACIARHKLVAATVMHLSGGQITVGVGGVQAPIIVSPVSSEIVPVQASGTILGFSHTPEFDTAMIELQQDALVVACSDGIHEAESDNGEFFDLRTLAGVLADHTSRSLSGNLLRILDAVFCHAAQQRDDLSIITIRCRKPDPHQIFQLATGGPRWPKYSAISVRPEPYRFNAESLSCVA